MYMAKLCIWNRLHEKVIAKSLYNFFCEFILQ
jgi:hypothetical protein